MTAEGADAVERGARRTRRTPARRARTPKRARDFYGSALDSAERIEFERAADIEGLDEEIALLRTKLRGALAERPSDLPLMLRGIELLVKAVSARYRLSKKAERELADSLGNVLRGVGGLLLPEAFEDDA